MTEKRPKLTLNIRQPTEDTKAKDAVKAAAKRKQTANETMDDAWQRILTMKNSDADQRRLFEVKSAMDAGTIGRSPADRVSKTGKPKAFSKAEALRLWRVLDAEKQARRLREMVEEMPDNYRLITDESKLDEFLSILANEQEIVFDVETTGVDIWSDYIVGHVISAVKADVHAYIPTKHKTKEKQLDHGYVTEKLRSFYEDESIGKIAHNAN